MTNRRFTSPRALLAVVPSIAVLIAVAVTTARAEDGFENKPVPSFLQWQAAGGANRNPVEAMKLKTGDITGDLSENQTGQPVQAKQKAVIGTLDKLIKQIEEQKQQQGDGTNGGRNDGHPMQHSSLAKSSNEAGPLHDPAAGKSNWNGIPPKERQKILQSQTEGFPAGYEAELSSYYNRLAAQDPAGPTTKPSR